jgi:copper homeostasis protein CutC
MHRRVHRDRRPRRHSSARRERRRLGDYAAAAEPEIKILAGGGIDLQVIAMIRAATLIREFHVGRAARGEDGVVAPQVAELAAALR